jgi:uncharacterized membrane protein YfcA
LTLLLPSLFFLTGLAYAMAGLAGGSTYLALLALFDYPYGSIPKVALLCNLVVSAGGTWHFVKAGHLDFKRIVPFLIGSIPAAYLGGRIPIGRELFTLLLGLSLAAAAARLLILDKVIEATKPPDVKNTWAVGLVSGALLGLISGLVGIGGGIFLAPVLLFLRWAGPRQAAAAASLFILVNSASGLLGQFSKGGLDIPTIHVLPLIAAAFLGGQMGSRLGAGRIPSLSLQRITGFLILTVALRLLGGLW